MTLTPHDKTRAAAEAPYALDPANRLERLVPTPDEVRAWDIAYKARYRIEHRARNEAYVAAFAEGDDTPLRLDHAAAHVEATVAAAESLVRADHEAISVARGFGYECGRLTMSRHNLPTDWPTHDEHMACHAGWFQGYPKSSCVEDREKREKLAADILNDSFADTASDGVSLHSAAHPPGELKAMADAIAHGPLTVRWLQCSGFRGCGWRMEDGAVGVPECPKCGGELHIHRRPA